jgi:hypothetical protein
MDKKEYWNIEKLYEWDKNPRTVTTEGIERLKKQITKLGIYKPLLITKEGIVLGGNMRLRALKEMEIQKVWVSVVNPKDENEMLEFNLSDNDRVGQYDQELLNELLPEFNLDWSDYAVDLLEPTLIKDITQTETGFEEKNREVDPEILAEGLDTVCPKCGFQFKHDKT